MNLRSVRSLIWCTLFAVGCSRAKSAAPPAGEVEVTELRYQRNPAQVALPELAEDLGFLAPIKLVSVGTTFSGPADIQAVATGDSDFGAAFNGAVLKLVAAGAPLKAVVGAYGVDAQAFGGYYVLADSPIRTARDLIGKKVAMNTLGAHAEFILREYLQRNGLNASEAKQVERIVLPSINIEQALRAGQVDVGVLSNMQRDKALERGGIRALFSDYELYGAFTAGTYVLRERFLRDNPKTSRRFVEGVAKAIEWARSQPREQVVVREQAIAKRHDNGSAAEAVRYWRSTGIAEQGGLIAERELTMWLEWLEKDKALKPGQLKLSALYTNEFNPYRKH